MEWVSKSELVGQIEAAGLRQPSVDQFKRLTREGLLQRSTQRHPAGRQGSVSVYPAAAVDQAIGVLRIRQTVKPFDHLRFWAFWEGLWVESRQLKATLAHYAKNHFGSNPTLSEGDDPFDLAEDKVTSVDASELARRLRIPNRHDAQSALMVTLTALMGGDPGWDYQPLAETDATALDEATPKDAAQRLLRLDRLTAPIGDLGAIVDEEPDPGEILGMIAETDLGNPGWWAQAIRTTPIGDLRHARDTARTLVEDLPLIAHAARHTTGGDLLPRDLVQRIQGPVGHGRAAIEHRVGMIGLGLVLQRLTQQEVVTANLDAMRNTASLLWESETAG